METLDWIIEHWDYFVAAAVALYVLISFIVWLTPTRADDVWWKRTMERVSFLKPKNIPGLLSLPGVRDEPEDPFDVDTLDEDED